MIIVLYKKQTVRLIFRLDLVNKSKSGPVDRANDQKIWSDKSPISR